MTNTKKTQEATYSSGSRHPSSPIASTSGYSKPASHKGRTTAGLAGVRELSPPRPFTTVLETSRKSEKQVQVAKGNLLPPAKSDKALVPISSNGQALLSPMSKRRLFTTEASHVNHVKKPLLALENTSSTDNKLSHILLKKVYEIHESVHRTEKKVDLLLSNEEASEIEGLFEEVFPLPVDDKELWDMLEDFLCFKENQIKLVSFFFI